MIINPFKKAINALCIFSVLFIGSSCIKDDTVHIGKETLGKHLFEDTSLSEPAGQSCATCHEKSKGYADMYSRIVSEGAVKGLFGNRNAPSASYATFVPEFSYDQQEEEYMGGVFLDGRSNDIKDQAGKPFLNPLEMGNPDIATLVSKVKKASYYAQLENVYGSTNDIDLIFDYVTDAIAAYESSNELNPFNSRYDEYLAGKTQLTSDEQEGLELFKGKGMCANCHVISDDARAGKPLFTDHTYDNLGIPKNPNNPFYTIPSFYNPLGESFIDLGLGAIVGKDSENGKFRVLTLRNIEKTAPYGHNGYFATLKDIIHFYNARDVDLSFPPAEYPATVNRFELGNLGLTDKEEDQIRTFLLTLSDK